MLVGNKKDIRNDTSAEVVLHLRHHLMHTKRIGHLMSCHIGAYDYLECSAKLNDGVKEVFETAIQAANHVLCSKD